MVALNNSQILLVSAATVVIIFAIVITAVVQGSNGSGFSQIITVGPLWNSDSWSCTSDSDFIVHGTLRGLEGAFLEVSITDLGSQSLYSFTAEEMESFSIGSPGGQVMTITRTGILTGWLTLQTTSDAKASCTQI